MGVTNIRTLKVIIQNKYIPFWTVITWRILIAVAEVVGVGNVVETGVVERPLLGREGGRENSRQVGVADGGRFFQFSSTFSGSVIQSRNLFWEGSGLVIGPRLIWTQELHIIGPRQTECLPVQALTLGHTSLCWWWSTKRNGWWWSGIYLIHSRKFWAFKSRAGNSNYDVGFCGCNILIH